MEILICESSRKYRPWVVSWAWIPITLALLSLLAFSALDPGHFEPGFCLSEPEACLGCQVQIAHAGKVIRLLPDGFVVEQLGATARVVGDNAGLTVGDAIHLRGTWQANGTIQAEAFHPCRGQRWRVWISIPAILLAAWLFWRTFRWDFERWVFTTRDDRA